jgi:hypothetical protein
MRLVIHCRIEGINHEARDFARAVLLHLIDHLEKNNRFIDLMRNNNFIKEEVYQNVRSKMERSKCKF